MGRRGAAVASVSTADSLPSSAESSFRELDDAFLQSQTRIWLGEVLNIRLDDDVHISDLLADGDLLFEVSKVVWNMLLTKCAELWHFKPNLKGPLMSRKSSGRYMPYSNVDSFLKICKILGLNGIDLFSPSDVVETKNTRRVCICIRALSKKARSKQLPVPDFDIVTYTVVMPTDMVGCIRRSLESSQSSFSSSSSYGSHKQSISKFRQKTLISRGDKNDYCCSEDSDEAESNYMGTNSHCLAINNLENAGTADSNLENSPGAYSVTKEEKCTEGQYESQYDVENLDTSKFGDGGCKLVKFSRSMKSSLKHLRNDPLLNNMSFDQVNYQSKVLDRAPCLSGDKQGRQNKGSLNFDLAYQNGNLVVGDTLVDNVAERDYISEYLAFSDSVVFGADGSSPVLHDGEGNSYNFFLGIDAHGSEFKGKKYENGTQRIDSDVEDEVSSTASMSSVLGRVITMEFDDRFDLDASSTTKDHSKELLENETEVNQDNGSLLICGNQGMDEYETPLRGYTRDATPQTFKKKVEDGDFSSEFSETGDEEQLTILESHDIECFNGPHRVPGKHSSLKDAKLIGADKDKESVRDEITGKAAIGNNIFGSGVGYEQHTHVQILADNLTNVSGIRPEDSNSSCSRFSVEGSKRWCCSMHNQDGVAHHFPDECVPVGAHPYSSTKVADGGSEICDGACLSVEKSLHSAEYASEENRSEKDKNMVKSVGDWRKDTTVELSRDKRKGKLLKTVAKGTAVIGVLFLLLHVRKRVGDDNGKARKKPSGAMQKVREAEFSIKRGEKGGGVNGIYPGEKLKVGK